eukprot:CAMPEP_0119034874 /NCGR_PEP_ID=MMETSP1177-20130426/1896_1 /TAXON_ID=2985 /ORGANISM="Ochromonas sp, Strain CCMP1899" /LENGTH=711 /DNA_ID=CAMNT_0006992673 /DNA_START=257 /DNA_END=2389 /DNA_ORIENTATION=+
MEENDQALLDWVNTFDIPIPCSELSELSDGTILIAVLTEISPEHFNKDLLNKDAGGNWALCANNLRKLLRLMDDFYKSVLKKSIDMSCVNVDTIAKNSDPDSLLELLELIVGAAVMCERKATFIQAIFGLDHLSQTVLKGMVEHAMHRMQDYPVDGEGVEGDREDDGALVLGADLIEEVTAVDGVGDSSEELIRAREMVRHLQGERHRLLSLVGDLEAGQSALKQEADAMQTLREQSDRDKEQSGGERSNKETAAITAINVTLQMSVDEAKREVDLRDVENEGLKADLRAAKQRAESMRGIQSGLEMKSSQMADELDVGRDKGLRLIKAESQIVKYQQRIEEMSGLKKLNKELSDKNDQYMDQIHELESSNRGIETLRKQVDEYKVKNVKLETEKFEAISESQVKDHEVTRLSAELMVILQSKRNLEDELQSSREEIAAAIEDSTTRHNQSSSSIGEAEGGEGEGVYEVETVLSLREKLKRVERELLQSRGGVLGAVESHIITEEVAVLQMELEEGRRKLNTREEALLLSKKQLSDTQSDLHKMTRAHEDLQQQSSSSITVKEQSKALKDHENRVFQTENTLRLLEETLQEKEGTINRLEQEKGKLENYAKRTLTAFKEKYMAALQGMKQEKRALEERLTALSTKAERNQETSRREERLLMSAMYDLGLRMMDKKIQDPVSPGESMSPYKRPLAANTEGISNQNTNNVHTP